MKKYWWIIALVIALLAFVLLYIFVLRDMYTEERFEEIEIVTVTSDGVTNIETASLSEVLEESTETTEETSALTDEVTNGLIFMYEEEKLARDVYKTLYESWPVNTLGNISEAEQTHMDAVAQLMATYGIQTTTEAVGVFNNAELQSLYSTLIAQGEASEEAALRVGGAIEEIDILDLQEYIAQTENADVILVYENLMKGSRNHLRAFVNRLNAKGATYAPGYLSQDAYDEIVGAEIETGSQK